MCGVAGFAGGDGRLTREHLQGMCASLAHRGPDFGALLLLDENGRPTPADRGSVGLAHRRLSIIDLSPAGHQPMSNEDGSVQLVYNGEFYNFQDYRGELEQAGHRFRSRTDTETIIHLYEQHDIESTLRRMNGMFAFALWDQSRRTLVLARDRVGKKPLYYTECRGGGLAFASELKALIAAGLTDDRDIDEVALAQFWAHGYIMGDRTIYRSIRRLPPGHYATWKNGRLAVREYWDCPFRPSAGPTASLDALADELEHLLRDAIRIRLIADVPVGLFLSGGIDSSLIAALSAQVAGRSMKTFSIAFQEDRYNEAPYARSVAEHLGLDNVALPVTEDLKTSFERIARQFDEPFGDSSAIPTWYLSKLTREHVTVALSGDGGDELFAGYPTYGHGLRLWGPPELRSLQRDRLSRAERVWESYYRLHARGRWPVYWARALSDRKRKAIASRAFADVLASPAVSAERRRWLERVRDEDLLSQLQYLDLKLYLPDDILVKVDRMSMAHGLECRCPLLDHRVIEFASRLPTSAKLDPAGRGKALLRHVLARHVPSSLIDRPKKGFAVPWDIWCQGPLGDTLRDTWRRKALPWFRKGSEKVLFPRHRLGHASLQWYAYVSTLFLNTPPRVRMLIWHFAPGPQGGAERQCLRLSDELAEAGVDVGVITHRSSWLHMRKEWLGHVRVRRMGVLGTLTSRLEPWRRARRLRRRKAARRSKRSGSSTRLGPLAFFYWLDRLAFIVGASLLLLRQRSSINILHVHESHWIASFGAWAGSVLGFRVLVKEATYPVLMPMTHALPFASRWEPWRKRADYIAQTQAAAEALAEAGVHRNITVVANGVDLPPESADVVANRGVLYVGNLSQGADTKSFDVLFKAWKAVVQAEPDAHLYLVGEYEGTPWMDYAQQLGLASSTTFTGRIDDPSTYYRRAAVFVLPSRREGMSNALLEAQSWGIPAVVSDIPGNRAVVEDGQNGIVIPLNAADALATAILQLYRSPDLRKQMGDEARRRMRLQSMPRMAGQVLEVYRRMLNGTSTPATAAPQ